AAPERGDIVILFSPKDGTRLVKRVVAVPGDSVAMRANRLIVNGEPGAYGPLDPSIVAAIDPAEQPRHRFATERIGDRAHAVMFTPTKPAPRTFGPVTVPADKFCVMGDNRDNSGDSRVFGFADRSLIVGHVTGVVLSLDPDHHYLPRWRRWFHGLK
ncbi:MAG: signal peptidase I, partial [Phycisphaerae bacterium]